MDCNIESFYATDRQKNIDCFSVDGFCSHCNAVLEGMVRFDLFCRSQEVRPSFTEDDIQPGSKKRELDESRRNLYEKRAHLSLKCGSVNS